jgi:hypothetical protein
MGNHGGVCNSYRQESGFQLNCLCGYDRVDHQT